MRCLLPWILVLGVALPALGQQPPKKKGISVGEPPTDHSPEAELKSFKVLDGFEVNLFASEADGIPNPIAIRWDERGRLWVLQTSDYPQPKPGTVSDDKIIILEDTNHDGRADKSTVFTGGLSQPMGMELAPADAGVKSPNGHSVYVGEGEKLWLMHDDDGDDKVDRREVVLRGFGTGDTHQCLNSFIWAPDGALVMHQGLHCYSKVATVHGTKTLYGAGFWHYYPKSGRLNPYPTGMPLNAWGTAFTKWGQPIMVAGAAGMFWARPMEVSTSVVEDSPHSNSHGIPHFLLERFQLPNSGQIIRTDGLRKFCGIDIVGNAHWPEAMQEEVISGGFFENAVYRYKLRPHPEFPSGVEAVEQPALITSDNVAFRPIDIRFGPEGALYVADWYDPIIGHYQASFRHPNRDAQHGRIWRVVAKGRDKVKLEPLPKMKEGNIKSPGFVLADAIAAPDRWEAYQSQRLQQAYGRNGETIQYLAAIKMMDSADVPQEHFLALMTNLRVCELGEMHTENGVKLLLGSNDARIRAYVIHTCGEWAFYFKPSESLAILNRAVADPSPAVRLEAVVAAAKIHSPKAIQVALKVLDQPMDSFIERALWLAVHATAPQWKKPPFEILHSLPPKHLAFLVEKEGSTELLGVVREMLAKQGESMGADTRRGLVAALVRKGQAEDMLMALKLGLKDQAVLEELAATAQRGKAPEGVEAILMDVLKGGNEAQKSAACVLAGTWNLRSADALIRELLNAGEGIRAPALTALARLGGKVETFEGFANDSQQTWTVRTAALAALAEKKASAAGLVAATALSGITEEGTMRAWLAPVLAREAALVALAKALEKKPCSPEAAKLAMTALTAVGRGDAVLTTAFGKILGVKNTLPAYDPAWVTALAAEVKSNGDAAKGKAVFQAPLSACIACHKVAGQGGIVGPELDNVGRGVPVELLIEAVVWPNRQIKEGYVATTLELKDGRRLQGYKVSEAGGELQLRDLLSGQTTRFTPAQIQQKQEAGSLMPEGLIMNMTREELRDLIAYLTTLGRE